ncbi:hypothetical protein F4604DRAFT_1922255 [Suillus subluteus]|nr:hypothetical protein F4604DRAFT_1922255 [Suillus subluteus]
MFFSHRHLQRSTASSITWEFYYNIIDFIRNGGDKDWVEDLRKWWNEMRMAEKADQKLRVTTDERGGGPSGSMDSLVRMRAQVAACSTTAKSSAAPAIPDPPPPPAQPITPPPSSPTPHVDHLSPAPLPPAIAHSLSASKVASSSHKSPALSELTDDEDALDDITNRKSKLLARKTHAKRKGKKKRIEDSEEELEVEPAAKRARRQTCKR